MTGLRRYLRLAPEPVGRLLRAVGDEVVARQLARGSERDLAAAVAAARGPYAEHLVQRMRILLRALDQPVPTGGGPELVRAVELALADADAARLWLALAVLTARLPLDEDVVEALRRLRLDGPARALSPALARATSLLATDRLHPARVEVVIGAVLVDVHHTSRTALATGIQRVARETVRRWDRDHEVVLVGWTDDYEALQRLGPADHDQATGASVGAGGSLPTAAPAGPAPEVVLVPWAGSYVTLELATEEPRTARMLALAKHSRNATAGVGFDCVPLTSAETAGEAMGGAFARTLAAVREMDRLATISEAAAVEYRGWRSMLAGAGLTGPEITVVSLPVEAHQPAPEALAQARSRFAVGALPVVLCVGSHEPRKNHLAVLHAAELLWRQGLAFSLLLVGGNSWNSERFVTVLAGMRNAGRPVESVSALSDDMLWAVYALAHVVVFPSLNEGFGLPVAEGLASGTPVLTSAYGSMAEIARPGGTLLVDPRDDHAIVEGLGRLLGDPALHRELTEQAGQVPRRSWDDYAADLWSRLVSD